MKLIFENRMSECQFSDNVRLGNVSHLKHTYNFDKRLLKILFSKFSALFLINPTANKLES